MKRLLSELEYEFDPAENHPITFDFLTPGRRKPVIWSCGICKRNWPATVSNRLKGTGCPYCAGKLPIPGETDLAALFPLVAEEWDYSKNTKGPDEYLPYSNKKVAWVCESGHRWEAKINNRTRKGLGCPYCGGSRPIPGVNDLGTLYPWLKTQWNFKLNGNLVPSDVFAHSNKRVNWICNKGHGWVARIDHRANGQGCPYCAGVKPIIGETDLETLEPGIAQQWSKEKNEGHLPLEYTRFSHYEAWWQCEWGHEYRMPIYRKSRGCGCSVCDGKTIIPGVNDFASRAPHLVLEWNHEGNNGVGPDQVTLHSNTKYSWICAKCGHVWKASPNNRAAGKGCPKCAGCCVDAEINSFAAINPHLFDQWDIVQNKPLTAWNVAAYDNRNYYWICENGHSFSASPANRTKGTGCPYCKGKLPIAGVNDFASVCPDVAVEWHPTKNKGRLLEQFLPNSHEEVWWRCKEGHEWEKSIRDRVKGNTCPYCQERLPIVGESDLTSQHPELAKCWSFARNKKGPEAYFPDNTVRVWWECEEGHTFRSPICEMVLRWRCPRCERKQTAPWRK